MQILDCQPYSPPVSVTRPSVVRVKIIIKACPKTAGAPALTRSFIEAHIHRIVVVKGKLKGVVVYIFPPTKKKLASYGAFFDLLESGGKSPPPALKLKVYNG